MSEKACLNIDIRKIGGTHASFRKDGGILACNASLLPPCASYGFRRTGMMTAAFEKPQGLICSFGLMCKSSIGDDWPLWASDQIVLTIDGGKVYVTKAN